MMAPPPRASQRLRRLAGHVVRSGAQHEADLARLGELVPQLWEQSRNDPNEEVIESPWHSVPLFDASKQPGGLTAEQKRVMDEDGHIVLPGILTEDSIQRLIDRLGAMNALNDRFEAEKAVKRAALERERDAAVTAEEAAAAERALDSWAAEDGSLGMRLSVSACIAEYDEYIESCVGHPQMLGLVRSILGEDIRFDHCCSSSQRGGGDTPDQGANWHGHTYADGTPTFADEFHPQAGGDEPSLGFIRICAPAPRPLEPHVLVAGCRSTLGRLS